MPVVVPVSEVFSFSIYHLLPLADPVAPFPTEVVRFPRAATVSEVGARTAMRLSDAADVIRSKNAGPFTVTVDLFFGDEPKYAAARSSSLLTVEGVAAAYAVPGRPGQGRLVGRPDPSGQGLALRWSSSSDPFCSDLFGAHLHTPLAQAELTPRGAES